MELHTKKAIFHLETFLNLDEIDSGQISHRIGNEQNAMEIRNCNFSWYEKDEEMTDKHTNLPKDADQNPNKLPFLLKNINMDITLVNSML